MHATRTAGCRGDGQSGASESDYTRHLHYNCCKAHLNAFSIVKILPDECGLELRFVCIYSFMLSVSPTSMAYILAAEISSASPKLPVHCNRWPWRSPAERYVECRTLQGLIWGLIPRSSRLEALQRHRLDVHHMSGRHIPYECPDHHSARPAELLPRGYWVCLRLHCFLEVGDLGRGGVDLAPQVSLQVLSRGDPSKE